MSGVRDIRQLTGLRGVAALSVALVHLHFDKFALVRFFEFHDQAVDLFFCLSGFTLSLVYHAHSAASLPFKRYATARVARIYPLYAVMLALCWWQTIRHLAGSPLYPTPLLWADTLRNLFLVNSWPLLGSGSNWDSPAWSLSVEAFCYALVFPALFALSSRAVALAPAWRLAAVILLSFASFIAFSRYWDLQILIARAYTAASQTAYWIPLLRGITLFTAGWIIHGFWLQSGPIAAAAGAACDSIALAALLILVNAHFALLPKASLILIAAPLILGLAVNDQAIISRLLASRPCHFLGEISYAVYLIHEPLQNAFSGQYPAMEAAHPDRAMLLVMAALLGVATLSYYGFESPMRALINRSTRRSRRAQQPGGRV
jgi:peptidoglycan/LPS O-acetylase OafA/YrhL